MSWLGALLAVLLLAAACDRPADEAEEAAPGDEEASEEEVETFYDGATVDFIVPFSAGGGSDTQGRFMAPYLSEHIPGSPSIQVVNIEGGAGIIGSNEYAVRRDPDGSSVLFSSASSTYPYLFGDQAVEFDYQEMIPAFGVPAGAAVYVSPDTGVEEPADLADPDTDLIMAEQDAVGLGALFLVAWELLGIEVEPIFGYEGRGPARVAFEQGESNIDYQTLSAYRENVQPLIEEGSAIPLFSTGQLVEGEVVEDPGFPDLPTVKDVYEEIHGEEPSGEAWEAYQALLGAGMTLQKVVWLHGDTPDAAVQAWREGGVALQEDQEMWEEGGEETLEYDLVVGDEIQAEVDAMLDVDQDTIDWLVDFLVTEYDAELEQ